jgi:MscS family membrane protein
MFRTAGDYAITALARHYWDMVGLLLAWVCSGWLLIRVSDIVVSFLRHRLLLRMQVERVTFVGLMGRLFNILIGIVLVFGLLKMGGVDISALVAGLGIGGIALALAAQRTLADLFGGLSVIMRGAVRVGDFCTIDGVQGTVEDIGISSINLRTMDRSLVSIPNAKVAEGKLENFSMRDQFWLHQFFTLRFDTPHKVVKIVLDRIVQLLATEPDTYRESARARLIGFTPAGPQIEVFAYFRNPDGQWATFLGTQEKIILRIMSIVESEGAGFASPNAVMMAARDNPEKPVDSANTDV